jgi:NADH-quinone oxidoreductase subunit A
LAEAPVGTAFTFLKETAVPAQSSGEYLGLLLVFLASLGVAGGMLLVHRILGPSRPTEAKAQPFECGVQPFQLPHGGVSVKFYLIAMLFILFDVEIVWLFPWAVALRELGWPGIGLMFLFVGVLVAGFVYAWKKGALEWQR